MDKIPWTLSDLRLNLNDVIWIYIFQTHQVFNNFLLSFYASSIGQSNFEKMNTPKV